MKLGRANKGLSCMVACHSDPSCRCSSEQRMFCIGTHPSAVKVAMASDHTGADVYIGTHPSAVKVAMASDHTNRMKP